LQPAPFLKSWHRQAILTGHAPAGAMHAPCKQTFVYSCILQATAVTCPKGSRRVKCKADICEKTSCPSNTTCVIQACGICKATCIKKVPVHHGGHAETEPAAPQPIKPRAGVNTTASNSSDACADGSAPFKCLVNPCATVLCVAPSVCQPSYCGGCTAACTLPAPLSDVSADGSNTGSPIDGIAASEFNQRRQSSGQARAAVKGGAPGRCQDGSTLVDCQVDPCKPPGGFHFFGGSMLHGHFRQTTMALPTRVELGEPLKL
jgi:hypothetical protein